MSEHSRFDRDYFEGEDSHFAKLGGFELLTKLNIWRLKRFKRIIMEQVTTHKTMLDIGCGYGHLLEFFKDDFEVYGTDISAYALKITHNKVECPVLEGNLEDDIPFDKNFDLITAIDVIEHMTDPKKAVQNIFNHLTDGGIFCFQLPTVSNGMSSFINKIFFARDESHIFVVSVDEIEELMKSVGFKKIAVYSSLTPIFTKNREWVRRLCYIFGIFKK